MFNSFEPNKIFSLTSKAPKYVLFLFIIMMLNIKNQDNFALNSSYIKNIYDKIKFFLFLFLSLSSKASFAARSVSMF